MLSLIVEVTKADGNKPADGKKVALANNSINALFQRHYPMKKPFIGREG